MDKYEESELAVMLHEWNKEATNMLSPHNDITLKYDDLPHQQKQFNRYIAFKILESFGEEENEQRPSSKDDKKS